MSSLAGYLQEQRPRFLAELCELLRVPSISTDPARRNDVARAAQWVRDRLAKAGCTRATVYATNGHPVVYGEWLGAPGKPTLLVYGHYDVQPPEPLDKWSSPPFEPSIRDGRIYARGASDDKGQFIIYVNALEAHLKVNGTCPVNIKFVLEGEEEIGSPSLPLFLDAQAEMLACDAVAVSDTEMFAKGVPSLCYSLRGLSYLQIDVVGTSSDLHSGTFGGAVVNPAVALTQMLASLKDKRGHVTIPRFYDKVRKLSAAERKAFKSLPHSDSKLKKEIGAPALFGEEGFTTLERMWARPSFDINGIWSGFTGEGAKTIIPGEAHAKISMRLVPDQKSAEITSKVERHLKKIAPKSVKVTVTALHGGEPWIAELDHPAIAAAGRAIARAFGKAPVPVREGGSIPIVGTFSKVLKVPCALMGIGLGDDNLHAPNEKLDLDNFYRGMEAAAFLFEELGKPAAEPAGRRKKR